MARFSRRAPFTGSGQKMTVARFWRVLAAGGKLPPTTLKDHRYVVIGATPRLRQAIFAEEQRLGLGNISPLGDGRCGLSVGGHAHDLEEDFYQRAVAAGNLPQEARHALWHPQRARYELTADAGDGPLHLHGGPSDGGVVEDLAHA